VEQYDFKGKGTSRVGTERQKVCTVGRETSQRNHLQEAEGRQFRV
jgi:hypothetical protein